MKHINITKFRQALFGGVLGILALISVFLFGSVNAATNISALVTEHWGWNDVVGWIDFYNTGTVTVGSVQMAGYASSSIGAISFDCATSPAGNVCGTSNYKVYNDGLGGLSGYAWNDVYGWISFCGGQGTADCPNNGGGYQYQAVIDNNTGIFQGTATSFAWNDILGWISFNCANAGGCSSNFKVVSSWRAVSATGTVDSTVFDTGVSGGAQLNSVIFRGKLPANTLVGFQFATANASSGPWSFVGSDGTGNTYYYPPSPDVAFPLSYTLHANQRYFRYRMTLFTDPAQRRSPQVTNVFINWSP